MRGPSSKRGGRPIVFEDWQTVGGGDGMYNVVDTVTNRYLYNESQFGAISAHRPLHGRVEGHPLPRPDAALRLEGADPAVAARPGNSSTTAPTSC